MADSWLTDGNCKECRRKNYCQKACTIHKRRREMGIRNADRKVFNERLGMDKIEEALKEGR
jgi:radical SAM protein with 4Fe4S-binding SPASM domain